MSAFLLTSLSVDTKTRTDSRVPLAYLTRFNDVYCSSQLSDIGERVISLVASKESYKGRKALKQLLPTSRTTSTLDLLSKGYVFYTLINLCVLFLDELFCGCHRVVFSVLLEEISMPTSARNSRSSESSARGLLKNQVGF